MRLDKREKLYRALGVLARGPSQTLITLHVVKEMGARKESTKDTLVKEGFCI